MDYLTQIKSPLWQRKRNDILNLRGYKCEQCGDTETQLHVVHHRFYIKGRKIHKYDNDVLQVLCSVCHEKVHTQKESIDLSKYEKYDSIFNNLEKYDENTLKSFELVLNILEKNKKLVFEYEFFWDMIFNIFNKGCYEIVFNNYFSLERISKLEKDIEKLNDIILNNSILESDKLNNIPF